MAIKAQFAKEQVAEPKCPEEPVPSDEWWCAPPCAFADSSLRSPELKSTPCAWAECLRPETSGPDKRGVEARKADSLFKSGQVTRENPFVDRIGTWPTGAIILGPISSSKRPNKK